MSSAPFVIGDHAEFAENKIRLVSHVMGGVSLLFGLAPATFISDRIASLDSGHFNDYFCDESLGLVVESAVNGVRFKDGNINEKSVVQFRLHRDKSISIVLDGPDLGVAFRNVKTAEPLYLVVSMLCGGDCVELLPEIV
jgi:hypothetical protein